MQERSQTLREALADWVTDAVELRMMAATALERLQVPVSCFQLQLQGSNSGVHLSDTCCRAVADRRALKLPGSAAGALSSTVCRLRAEDAPLPARQGLAAQAAALMPAGSRAAPRLQATALRQSCHKLPQGFHVRSDPRTEAHRQTGPPAL